MTIKELFKSKLFYRNLILAVVVTFVILYAASFLIDVFTRHGEEIAIEDLTGKTSVEVEKYLKDNSLRIVVLDSVFDNTLPKGTLYKQDPYPGEKVKRKRKVYVTYVATRTETSSVPDLNNLTLRQAVQLLYSNGLEVGKIIYQSGFDKNAIQSAKFEGRSLQPGKKIPKGSKIDLYVSEGTETSEAVLPRIAGLSLKDAKIMLFSLGFNISKINYSNDDNADRYKNPGVYRQYPSGNNSNVLSLGTNVELWVKPLDKITKSELEAGRKLDEAADSLIVIEDDELDLF